ncbi:MAG: histidine kinase [Streptosporangiaceae bacterium]
MYAWTRAHPRVVDGLLGLLLLACSAGQLAGASGLALAGEFAVNAMLALAVALRRTNTLAAFAAGAVIGLAQAVYGFQQAPVRALEPTVTDLAIPILLYTLAASRPRRESLSGLALCLAGSAIAIAGWTPAHHFAPLLLAVAALGATFVATWVLGDSARYRRAYYRSLEDKLAATERARDLEAKRAQAVDESAARLRRIERDLHDGAQVRLTALAMTLGEIKETMEQDPRGARAMVGEAHQNAKRTLAELRDLARGIHPVVLDKGLDTALRSVTDSSPIPARLDLVMAGRPSQAIEAIVYFSAAELVTNAAKHSGASQVEIVVRGRAEGILLTVRDDGTGGARVAAGGGLAGLRERVRTVDIMRNGLAEILTRRGHEVAVAVGDAEALIAAVAEHGPDVAVIDVRMPPSHTDEGLRAAVSVRRDHPGTAVLVFSQYIEPHAAAELFITQKVVEKHAASIFDKLGLSPSDNDNRRVLAAIRYLES